jgi:hypothetical protein
MENPFNFYTSKGHYSVFMMKTPIECVLYLHIVETKDLEEEQLLNALIANFHSALDVKYVLSDQIMWSVFIHPLITRC